MESIDLSRIASLARIRLTDEEAEHLGPQLAEILAFVEKLKEVDVEGVEPTAHAIPLFDVMREDEARPGFGAALALSNAPARVGDQFKVAKVIE